MSRSSPHPLSVVSYAAEECVLSPSKTTAHQGVIINDPIVVEDHNKENALPSSTTYIDVNNHAMNALTKLRPAAIHQAQQESPRRQHMRPFSPRKQTAQNKGVSFSPYRAQLPPRAWERIPAKPFAARSEGQKIWKRIPLQDIGIDADVRGSGSRKDREAKKDYLRAVKRMKVDADAAHEDVEDAATVNSGSVFWATRTEEESIEMGGSPKKKARVQHCTEDIVAVEQESVESNLESASKEDQNRVVRHRNDAPSCSEANIGTAEGVSPRSPQLVTPSNEEITGLNEDLLLSEPVDVALVAPSQHVQDSAQETTAPAAGSADTQTSIMTQNIPQVEEDSPNVTEELDTQHTLSEPGETLEQASFSMQQESESTNSQLETTVPDALTAEQLEGAEDWTAQTVHIEPDQADAAVPDASATAMPPTATTVDLDLEACVGLFDLSAPASCSEFDQSVTAETENNTQVSDILASMPSPDVNKAALSRATAIFPGAEQEEDTAFLANFLLRAKASKAAREATTAHSVVTEAPSPTKSSSPRKRQSPSTQNKVDNFVLENDIDDEAAPATEHMEDAEHTVEASASSPLRRSTRAASTLLPRPHTLPPVPQFGPVLPSQNVTLPNTIQLKRATGNEFVFNAKPQQTVQMMTRTNTKRNQGNAVHADVRLQQLKTETSTSATDAPVQQNSSPVKKRKRAKDEDSKASRKSKKNVKWQEELVSYREATPTVPETTLPISDDFAAIEAAAQAEALQSMTDGLSIPDTSRVHVNNADHIQEEPSKDVDATEKTKVRKMRQVSVGSVNGTPAPKTRTRSQMQAHAQAEPGPAVVVSTARSRSETAAKSKMPLPVSVASTSIPAAPGAQPTIDRKLDGRRRLRART